ncbi:hypothetical protein DPMN_058804 [Dreissena polymorpha]|uniref:J domain-containing protein n=1 Tax=Dreissena polymorpha TaxID=45954 RepID=A0A9D4HFW8_DREPO|nr:hypothetical protein DPMN_058804 [Dreissena polymorpha]
MVRMVRKSVPYSPQTWAVWSTNLGRMVHGPYNPDTYAHWDSEDLELFDLVEEINGNFYELLDIKRDDNLSEIKKAYKKKALKLHPDKNDAPDAEVQFRQLVAVYEILKEEEKRKKYDNVLDNGLPDWRQPVFYFRKARKLGLLELAGLLSLIVTVGQYFVMWAAYLERRLAMEDFFMSKRKRETKGKRGKAVAINEKLEEDLHQTLEALPKPHIKNLWPITFTKWATLQLVTLPKSIRERREQQRLAKEIREKERQEEERKREEYLKELDLRKQKRKVKHEPVIASAISSDVTPVMYGMSPEEEDSEDSASETYCKTGMKTGEWTDEDYVVLSKAYIKFPGGTVERWEKIADMVGRPVSEVTAKYESQHLCASDNVISKSEDDVVTTLKLKSSSQNFTSNKPKSNGEKLLVSVNEKLGASVPSTKGSSEDAEWALKQYPKGTDQRWEKIAEHIPGKSKVIKWL